MDNKEDLEFIFKIQSLLISKNGYIIDVGNYQNVNDELIVRLEANIKKHPLLWKWFFMVA